MRRTAAALAFALGAATVPVRAQVAGAAQGSRAAPPRLTVGVLGYRFRLALPDSGARIAGTAVVHVRRLRAGAVDTLPLDLVGLSVVAVRGAGGTRPRWSYDGRVLRVVLAPVRRPGPDSVTVRYEGTPADGLIAGALEGGRPFWFADDWPDRARGFIPTVDHPAFKAPVTWEVEAPAGVRVVANGVLRGVEDLARGRRRWTYVERRAIPTYTMVVGAAPFAVSRHAPSVGGGDTTANEVWTFPEDSAFADSVPFRRLTAIVEAGERLVGPFPYRKLAQVESATRYGGMENASAIFYDRGMYGARRMGEGVVRHETAHQWFGDAVTERDWRHLWLSEGFASYFDLVFAAALGDDSAVSRGMRGSARGYFASDVVGRPLVDSAADDLMGLLNANSYNKGAWLLQMLRGEVGDSAFFRGIRDYYRAYRDSSVLSEDFARVMERAAGRQLGWFFRQWLYQAGYPQLDVAVSVDSAAGRAMLTVRQAQPADWGLFRLPRVEVEFVAGAERVGGGAFALEAASGGQSFPFDVSRVPTSVRVDPAGRLLMTATVHASP